MPYAQRPMGDYKTYGYAGDPGWLSSLWKGVKKYALPVLGGIFGGGAGEVIGAATGQQMVQPQLAPPPGSVGGALTFPGGSRIAVGGVLPMAGAGAGAIAGAQPAGYHLDKKTRTRWVRNRRMNVANPRALRKAMRRVQGFEKLAKRTISFTRRVRIKK